jgi:pyridoxal biosynthesis lyase PdxS
VTLPMIYTVERTTQVGLAQRLVAVDQLNGDLASPAAIEIMRQAGISYIFIGDRGFKNNLTPQLTSPSFELVYQQGKVFVLRLKPVK